MLTSWILSCPSSISSTCTSGSSGKEQAKLASIAVFDYRTYASMRGHSVLLFSSNYTKL